ncbi:hypothetical protein FHS41_006309 [Streptomyces violarus]|uniref:Uncharacterized protein n=1 Tax=Streptomyces violarus TaxID=67380 RepID=A0A7W4ZWJ5_9ACTN|nr:hypothetical protein [Streptomyces violarus]
MNPPSSPRPMPYSTGRRRRTLARPHPAGRRPGLCRTVRLPCSAGGVGDAVGCWGVGGRRHAALPCSCTPRFLARAAAFRAGRWRPARGPARNRPGHTYPHGRSVIPARNSGRRRSAVRARHSTACSCTNGNQSTTPGHLPGTSPYPAVIQSGRLRS